MGCRWYFYGTSMMFLWYFYEITMWFLKGCYGNSMVFLRDFHWIPMGFLCNFYDVSMGFLWHYYGIPMAFLWDVWGNSMGFLWDFFVAPMLFHVISMFFFKWDFCGVPLGFPWYFYGFSPHWRVGFLFLVLYPPPPSARRPPVLLLTHTHTHTHSHTLTHSHTHSLTLTHTLTHSPHTHSLTHSLTHSHSHTLTHSLTLSLTLRGRRGICVAGVGQCALPRGRMYALVSLGAPPLLRGRRGTMCTAKESDVRPGVPWGSAAFAWQAWDNVHCQGVGCTPWRPLGLRRFCVAGVGQDALPRGLMYALASLGAPPLLRGRRGTICTAKGSDVRPGVPWGSAAFAWQAWDNVHCQGVWCTPWRPLGLRRFCVAGVGQSALSRGLMYALASRGAPPLLRGRRGTMCTAKGSDVRSGVPWGSAAFAWQAWDNVHCQGVWCTPWRPVGLRLFCVAGVGQCALPRGLMYALASLGAPPLLRGRRGTMCTAKGSDVRSGVPWGSAAFAWQAYINVHCQGVGCLRPYQTVRLRSSRHHVGRWWGR